MRHSPAFLPLIILVAVTPGCQNQRALAELQEMRAEGELGRQNIAKCRRLFEEIDRGNAEFVTEFYAHDVKSYSPSGSTAPHSREDLLALTQSFLHGFPDLHHTIEESISEGDTVTIRFTARGTHQGEFAGIPATGNELALSAISIMRFENGKVVEARQETDALGLMQQLGMELGPAPVEQ